MCFVLQEEKKTICKAATDDDAQALQRLMTSNVNITEVVYDWVSSNCNS